MKARGDPKNEVAAPTEIGNGEKKLGSKNNSDTTPHPTLTASASAINPLARYKFLSVEIHERGFLIGIAEVSHDRRGLHRRGDEAREAAAQRWKAIEAFNCVPGLTPVARRVGIALICFMDSRTRDCFPAAITIAGRLGVSERAVKKAKDELRNAGLIDWSNPGGPRHVSRYGFNWAKLERLQQEAKDAGEGAHKQGRKARLGNPSSPSMVNASSLKNQLNGECQFPKEQTLGNAGDDARASPPREGAIQEIISSEREQAATAKALEEHEAKHRAWRREREEKLQRAREAGFPNAYIDWNDNGRLKSVRV
jgi:hypothetical protein